MKGKERKQEILKIAYKMFITKGYENTSVDEIIAEAHIAKGTYYYYFKSKEETMEEVVNMMLREGAEYARNILASDCTIPEKLVGVITALRPKQDETIITDILHQKENIVMHEKINQRIIEEAVPILSELVSEGIEQGILCCDNIPQRVKMTLVMSNSLFEDKEFQAEDVAVFIDTVEKMLGALPGTLEFIQELIQQ